MTVDDEILPMNSPSVDLNNVSSLNHGRSVSFINSFLINTAHFLNTFSAVSEQHMAEQLFEMQKLEVAINILEAKLNSVPGLNEVSVATKPDVGPAPSEPVVSSQAPEPEQEHQTSPAEEVLSDAPDKKVITAKEDPRYARYFKMITVGVPKAAIEGKMRLDGLDPSLLDTPDAPVPDALAPDDDDDESDNESRSLSSDDDWD